MYGKPLKIKPEKLGELIDEYFNDCSDKGVSPLFPALLLHCGLLRDTWDDYRDWREEVDQAKYDSDKRYKERIDNRRALSTIIKKAELRLESSMSQLAINGKNTGAIFLLKQKPYGGYTDKTVTDIGGTDIPITINLKTSTGKDYKD